MIELLVEIHTDTDMFFSWGKRVGVFYDVVVSITPPPVALNCTFWLKMNDSLSVWTQGDRIGNSSTSHVLFIQKRPILTWKRKFWRILNPDNGSMYTFIFYSYITNRVPETTKVQVDVPTPLLTLHSYVPLLVGSSMKRSCGTSWGSTGGVRIGIVFRYQRALAIRFGLDLRTMQRKMTDL